MEIPRADPVLVGTRRALHGVAELVLAGPQYAAAGTIKLRVRGDGVATWLPPDRRLVGATVVAGDRTEPVDGRTPADLAAALGLQARPLDDVYHDGPGIRPDDVLAVDEGAARTLVGALAAGDAALRAFAPDTEPVLWPEHFDVGISVGEVNYGISPGDDHTPVPYAYVGPWAPPAADDFWTEPFGAARTIADLGDASGISAFFEEGRSRLPHSPRE
jgi:hypothetical protein